MAKMITCKTCGEEIAKSAKVCPHCGAKNKKPTGCLVFLCILFALMAVVIAASGGDSGSATPTAPVQDSPTPQETEFIDNSATVGEKNALRSAKSYLSFSAFSYKGLIRQLEFEGYTTAEATYGADHCGADWMEQALKSAKNYLDFSAFSHDGLCEQLEFEGFTSEEAKYGADNCGADWNEQAAKSAKNYLDLMGFSRSGLIEQLEFEGFTHEQAVYGVEANGM